MYLYIDINTCLYVYIDSRPGVTPGVTEEAWDGRWGAPEGPKWVSSRQFQVAGKCSVPSNAGFGKCRLLAQSQFRQMRVAGNLLATRICRQPEVDGGRHVPTT